MPKAFSLTDREVEVINQSWNQIKAQELVVGLQMFKLLFQRYPQYERLFTHLHQSGKSLYEGDRFQHHVVGNIMSSINKVIERLNSGDTATKTLKDMGVKHKKLDVHRKHFESFVPFVVDSMVNVRMSMDKDEVAFAWTKLMDAIASNLSRGVES
uniref:Hemoglobin B n=1 Tax=Anisops deanei TaxID=1167866 RepID=I2G908_9HEMI|nr:hemoglobin B [Anisops deanei]